jgi:methyl-accepting chemotaxis protein
VVTPETVGAVGASVAGPAFMAAVSLGMWAYFHEGSDTNDEAQESELAESLGVLAGDDLTPTARAELEAQLDLPPRTLANLSELLAGDSLRRLRDLCKNAPERMDEFEQRVEIHEAEIEKLRSTVERLEDEVGSLDAFYSEQLAGAAHTLDTVADQLERDETALLRPRVDAKDGRLKTRGNRQG